MRRAPTCMRPVYAGIFGARSRPARRKQKLLPFCSSQVCRGSTACASARRSCSKNLRPTSRTKPDLNSTLTSLGETMNFQDGSLFPENHEKLVITVAPYGPEWMPSDFPEDIAVTIDEQVQKAVDCYNAGATVLHVHVRELDGKGSKRLSKFNELLGRLRVAVPDMVLQVGGSIS